MTSALMLVLLQSGWALTQSPPRQVGRVYWELVPQTDTDCTPNAVEADMEPSILRSVATARTVTGEALGFPIKLVAADQVAVGELLARVGLAEDQTPKK